MELNVINSVSTYAQSTYPAKSTSKKDSTDSSSKAEEKAVVYEKSEENTSKAATYSAKSSKVDQATIDRLKADAEERYASLQSLVDKLISKQGETYKFANLGDFMKDIAAGKIEVDPKDVEQAKKDVADDGYWGVEQTAKRIVDFAKALTGGDASQLEKMRSAIDKGFSGAKKVWGSDLPEISSKTYDRVTELLDEWANE